MSEFLEIMDTTTLTLSELKAYRITLVKIKTGQLIGGGFTFDAKQFPADASANFNYNVMKVSKADFTFPKNIGTLTGETYALAEVDVDSFWSTAKSFIEPILEGNRTLINDIAIAVDIDAVNLIIDNR